MPSPLLEAIRQRLANAPGTAESRRLFHGRGKCFPGLDDVNVDWFAPAIVVTLYGARPDAWLASLDTEMRALVNADVSAVIVQRRFEHGGPIEVLSGTVPDAPRALERELRYRLRFGRSQNIGFFLDMRHGRDLVRELAPDRAVLNLFAYTCSFSVAALAGGAARVVNLDMSSPALDVGRHNHRDNGLDPRAASFLAHDLFKSFGKLKKLGPFDLIIVDPPTAQGRSFSAHRDWPRLIRRLPTLAAPGAEVIACLNAPHLPSSFLFDAFAEHLPSARLIEQRWPGEDFPEVDREAGVKVMRFAM